MGGQLPSDAGRGRRRYGQEEARGAAGAAAAAAGGATPANLAPRRPAVVGASTPSHLSQLPMGKPSQAPFLPSFSESPSLPGTWVPPSLPPSISLLSLPPSPFPLCSTLLSLSLHSQPPLPLSLFRSLDLLSLIISPRKQRAWLSANLLPISLWLPALLQYEAARVARAVNPQDREEDAGVPMFCCCRLPWPAAAAAADHQRQR